MKNFSIVFLGLLLAAGSPVFSEESSQMKGCACTECQCEDMSNCGCYSGKECRCGEDGLAFSCCSHGNCKSK